MTTEEDRIGAALRRLDRPHEPTPEAMSRLEAVMLDAFDSDDQEITDELSELGDPAEADLFVLDELIPAPDRKSYMFPRLLAAAAVLAIAVAVLSAVMGGGSDRTNIATPPDTSLAGESVNEWCMFELAELRVALDRLDQSFEPREDLDLAIQEFEVLIDRLDTLPGSPARVGESQAKLRADAASVRIELIADPANGQRLLETLAESLSQELQGFGGTTPACSLSGGSP